MKQPNRHLDEDDVRDILRMVFERGCEPKEIAEIYGMSISGVYHIIRGTTWPHVPRDGYVLSQELKKIRARWVEKRRPITKAVKPKKPAPAMEVPAAIEVKEVFIDLVVDERSKKWSEMLVVYGLTRRLNCDKKGK